MVAMNLNYAIVTHHFRFSGHSSARCSSHEWDYLGDEGQLLKPLGKVKPLGKGSSAK